MIADPVSPGFTWTGGEANMEVSGFGLPPVVRQGLDDRWQSSSFIVHIALACSRSMTIGPGKKLNAHCVPA